MARAKSKLRRVLNARFLRWWLARAAVLAVPPLGRWLGFFPRAIGLIEAADHVLQNEVRAMPGDELAPDLAFLTRCLEHDSVAPGVHLPDGVITGDRTVLIDRPWIDLATGSILLPERARTVLVRGEVANWNATSIRPGRRKVRVPGRVYAPLRTANYYHLLMEVALPVLELTEVPGLADAPVTLVKPAHRSAVEAAFYDGLLAVHPRFDLRIEAAGAMILPDQAIGHFPADNHWEWARLDRAAADRLTEVFRRAYDGLPAGRGPRLYLSRKGAKLRAPANEAAMEAVLEAHGFAPFIATDTNHPEQIAAFAEAETIVAVHGAGLANLAFARPGAVLIEIFPENFVKSTYWWMARRLGLRYVAVIGGPGDYDQRFDAPLDDLTAALEAG